MQPYKRRAVLLLPAALFACASPNPMLYTLAPVPGATRTGGPRSVVIHRVSIARYLERPEIVRSSENYRLDVAANEVWGEPLAQMIGRVLLQDLSQRMPGTSFFNVSGAITASGEASVEVDIQRMDKDASGALAFEAQAAVEFTAPRQGELTRALRTTVPVASPATGDEVKAMSIAIGQLADMIAGMLTSVPLPSRKR